MFPTQIDGKAVAEIEEFLETPVKRYSSGMYMRLAFAVAANLEPEILIVDEVLAVLIGSVGARDRVARRVVRRGVGNRRAQHLDRAVELRGRGHERDLKKIDL